MLFHRTSALRGVVLLTMTGIFSQVVGFIYRIILTHLVGAEILGLFHLIMPVYSVLLSLTSVGLTAAVSNLSARFQAVGNTHAIVQLRKQALRLFFLLAILPCALLFVFSDGASVYLLGDARTQLGLILLIPCLLLTGIENLQKYYFYGIGHILPPALTELAEQIIRTCAIVGLLLIFLPQSPEKTVGLIVTGMIVCEIFSAITQTVMFRRYLGSPNTLAGSPVPSRQLLYKIKAIALPMGLTALLGNLIGSANSVLIPRLLVHSGMNLSEAMSAFGVMFGMSLPMLFLPTAFLSALGLVLVPSLAKSAALGHRADIRRKIRKSVAAANLILIPALALLAVVGPGLGAALYGEPTVGDHLPILALGVLFSSWETLLACSLNGLNFQSASARIALLTDAVLLGVTCFTVGQPDLQLRGFAWGYVISSFVGAFLSFRKVSRETGLKLPIFDWFAAPILSSTLAAACARLLYLMLVHSGLSMLWSGCSALVFGILLYLSALQAQGVSLKRLLRENLLAYSQKKR